MQRRIAALVAAAVAVLGAVVVLFFRVRSDQDVSIPPDALAAARASYERGQTARPAPPPVSRTPSIPQPPPAAPEPEADPAARPASDRRGWRTPSSLQPGVRRSIDRESALDRETTGKPPADVPPDANPEVVAKRQAVSDAYDQGDYEAALKSAEEFLGLQPGDPYVKRVAAVAACAIGDEAAARKHYQELGEPNQRIVARRCSRFGVDL